MPFKAGDKRGEEMETEWIPPNKEPESKQLSQEEIHGVVERANEKQTEQFKAVRKVEELLMKKSGLSPKEVFEKMFKDEDVPFYQQMLAATVYFEGAMINDEHSTTLEGVGEMKEDKDEDEATKAIADLLAELSEIRREADDNEEVVKAKKMIENKY